MPHPLTNVQQRLQGDGPWPGMFLVAGSALFAEASSLLDLDWIAIDMEAAPMTKVDSLHMLQAVSASSVIALVRVPKLDRHLIEHALDQGAHGVIVPKIESAEDAAAAVDACRFPPAGSRGVNPIRASAYFTNLSAYFEEANDRTMCAVQIETRRGLEAATEIAAVPGVDIVFIGVGDLAMSLGQPGVADGSSMDEACDRILRATLAAGKIPGIFAYSDELAVQHIDAGFKLIAIGNEIKLFMAAGAAAARSFREAAERSTNATDVS